MHETESPSITADAFAVSVPTGTEEDSTHETESPSATAAASAVPVPTGTEEGSHGGPGFSPSNEKSVACPVMYLTDDPVRLPAEVLGGGSWYASALFVQCRNLSLIHI